MSNMEITTATESIAFQTPAASVAAKPSAVKSPGGKEKAEDAVIYEKNAAASKPATYSVNKMSPEERSAINCSN